MEKKCLFMIPLTLSWRGSLSYRNQSTDFLWKSMDCFLYGRDFHHGRVNWLVIINPPNLLNFTVFGNNSHFPAGNYMFKVNNGNTRTRCEICSKLTIKTPGCRSGVFFVNFEHIWAGKCRLGHSFTLN